MRDAGDFGELILGLGCRSLLKIADQAGQTQGSGCGSFSAATSKAPTSHLRLVQKRSRLAADGVHTPEHNKHAAPEQDGSLCFMDQGVTHVPHSFCRWSSLTSASVRTALPLWNQIALAEMGLLDTLVSPEMLANTFCAPRS